VLKSYRGFKFQNVSQGVEVNQREAIPEDIVYPADLDRLRLYYKLAVQQSLIKAISRPKKHLMRTKPYGLAITVNRTVMDRENRHCVRSSRRSR
jgi:hypothetical protein